MKIARNSNGIAIYLTSDEYVLLCRRMGTTRVSITYVELAPRPLPPHIHIQFTGDASRANGDVKSAFTVRTIKGRDDFVAHRRESDIVNGPRLKQFPSSEMPLSDVLLPCGSLKIPIPVSLVYGPKDPTARVVQELIKPVADVLVATSEIETVTETVSSDSVIAAAKMLNLAVSSGYGFKYDDRGLITEVTNPATRIS